jgi:excisionase family DNA binding protein
MDAPNTQAMTEIPRLAYSVTEAVAATGMSRATVNRKIASGELKSVKISRRRLIPAAELRRLCGDAAPEAPPQILAGGFPVPQVVKSHLMLADIRREDGRALVSELLGESELTRVLARREPFLAAMVSADGGFRSISSIVDAEHLEGFLNRARDLNLPASSRVYYAIEPQLAARLINNAALASGAGRA